MTIVTHALLYVDGTRQILDPHRHSVVELLLENYHRQLVLVGHDVAALKQEMESMQARVERKTVKPRERNPTCSSACGTAFASAFMEAVRFLFMFFNLFSVARTRTTDGKSCSP